MGLLGLENTIDNPFSNISDTFDKRNLILDREESLAMIPGFLEKQQFLEDWNMN